jgi:transcriptional regulator with PAS, ATPase and Fis domain
MFLEEGIIIKSKVIEEVFKQAFKFAKKEEPVLILGESGTGKEILARFIHQNSNRKEKPFIAINCAGIPETLIESELFGYKKGAFTDARTDKIGLFQVANTGTIFLDEIGDLSFHLQAKLLRVIENKEILPLGGVIPEKVDFRLICATNKNIFELSKQNKFRDDLLYRISTFTIEIPPLRERIEEIPFFIEKYLNEVRHGLYVAPEVMEILLCYPWEGNIRQLRNAIIYAANLVEGNCIKLEHLPKWLSNHTKIASQLQQQPLKTRMKEYEKYIIDYYKKIYGDNPRELSEKLGISLTSLYRKTTN